MTSPAAYRLIRRIQFADTDAAGVAHFSRLLVMVEEAEHDFLRSLQIPILTESSAWPCIALDVNYLGKCEFGDLMAIELHVTTIGRTSVTFEFHAFQTTASEQTKVFSGKMVKCHILPGQPGASAIPDWIRAVLETFLPQSD